MNYCVYLTIYFGNKLPRRYIGSSLIKNVKAGYNGSIKSKKYKAIYIKEQYENKHLFKTRILNRYLTQEEAIKEELRLQIKYDVVKSEKYMNMSFACPDGFFGKIVLGEDHHFYGKNHSTETKKTISNTLKELYKEGKLKGVFSTGHILCQGDKNPFYGKKHSEVTILKMKKSKTRVPKWKCPHCEIFYDAGNLLQHLKRTTLLTKEEIERGKLIWEKIYLEK